VVIGAHAEQAARLRGERTASVSLNVPLVRFAAEAGLSQAVARTALERLRTAGIVVPGRSTRLRADVLETTIGTGLAMDAVLERLSGDTSALLVCRAHAVLAPGRLDEWSEIPIRDVAWWTCYVERTVRRARDVLVEKHVVEDRPRKGTETAYRFADWTLGAVEPSEVAGDAASLGGLPAAPTLQHVLEAGARVRVGGVTFEVSAGATFEVPPGMRARLEIGADGYPIVHLEPA
jgi:hypothetical protein